MTKRNKPEPKFVVIAREAEKARARRQKQIPRDSVVSIWDVYQEMLANGEEGE